MKSNTLAVTKFKPTLKKGVKKGTSRAIETHLKIAGYTATLCGIEIPDDGAETTSMKAILIERAVKDGCEECVAKAKELGLVT